MTSKLIIFDLDDTLIDTFGSLVMNQTEKVFEKLLKAGLKAERSMLERFKKINRSSVSGKEAIRKFLAELGQENFLEIGLKEYYENNEVNVPVSQMKGATRVLTQLKENNYLVLVTYGLEEQQYKKMYSAGINKNWFSKILFVDQRNKKREYARLRQEFGIGVKNIVVCGDRYETDLIPAKELGMKTIHVCWGRGKISVPKEGEVDYIVTDLREIIKIVNDF